jgi:chromosome segregation ATPase
MRLAWPTLVLVADLLGLQPVVFRRIAGIDRTLDRIDARLDSIDAKLDRIDSRFDGIETRFDGIEARFDRLDALLAEILRRARRLEERGAPP